MLPLILLTAVCTMPPLDGATEDRCEILEVNHVFDDRGRECLTQLIGWDWSESHNQYIVVFWRLMKDDQPGMDPQLNVATQAYVSEWHDGDILRRVKARKRWERWLQYDVELRNRDVFAKDQRRNLTHDDDHYRRSTDTPSDSDLEVTP